MNNLRCFRELISKGWNNEHQVQISRIDGQRAVIETLARYIASQVGVVR
jgi:hypothetical protein